MEERQPADTTTETYKARKVVKTRHQSYRDAARKLHPDLTFNPECAVNEDANLSGAFLEAVVWIPKERLDGSPTRIKLRPMSEVPKTGRDVLVYNQRIGWTVVHWAQFIEDHPPIEPALYYWTGAQYAPYKEMATAKGWIPMPEVDIVDVG